MPKATSDITSGLNCIYVWALQVPLEGSEYDAYNKDFYLKLFQSKNVSVSGPYVKKFSRTNYGHKEYFAIRQQFMGDNKINRAKAKANPELEAAKYRG